MDKEVRNRRTERHEQEVEQGLLQLLIIHLAHMKQIKALYTSQEAAHMQGLQADALQFPRI